MCMYKIYMNIEYCNERSIISDIIIYNKIGFFKPVNFRGKGREIRRMIQKYNYA